MDLVWLLKSGSVLNFRLPYIGGLHKAVLEAVDIGAKAFGMFLKSQRQWNSKPMDEKAAEKFRDACAVRSSIVIKFGN